MKCLKEKCIHHEVCALYTFSGYASDECGFYETRPHGEWEWQTEDKYRCSACKANVRVEECMNEPQYDFCPNCGADMRTQNDRSWDTSERGVSGSVKNSIAQEEGDEE